MTTNERGGSAPVTPEAIVLEIPGHLGNALREAVGFYLTIAHRRELDGEDPPGTLDNASDLADRVEAAVRGDA